MPHWRRTPCAPGNSDKRLRPEGNAQLLTRGLPIAPLSPDHACKCGRNVTVRHELLPSSAAVPVHSGAGFHAKKSPNNESVRSGSMSKKKTAHMSPATAPDNAPASEQADLDSRYGAIGIPAVAAALPYRGAVKNPVYASSADELDKWIA